MLDIKDGFVSCFLAFYLCIPFLNILISNMDKKQHGLLILLCFFIYTLHGTLPMMSVSMNYVSWFCVVYFIASYIRLYPSKKLNNANWGGVFFTMHTCLCHQYCSNLMDKYPNGKTYFTLSSSF